jgi:hypothetical protein
MKDGISTRWRRAKLRKIDWRFALELVGMALLILSVIFLAIQIRQDHTLTRAALGSQTAELLNELELTASDPNFAKTYEKMLREPDSLTDDEMIQINSYLYGAKMLIERECYLAYRGVFKTCRAFVRKHIHHFFGSRYAQSWWRVNRQLDRTRPLDEWIQDEIEELASDSKSGELKMIRDGI